MTPEALAQYQKAINDALAKNKDIAKYAGINSVNDILDAYTTGNWSNIIGLSGKPFTKEQQLIILLGKILNFLWPQ